MVLFLIADLALTLAFKMGAWCLGKTYNGIVYLLATSNPQKSNPCEDDCVIVLSRHEYDALNELRHVSSSSEDASLSSSSSK